MLSYSVIIIAVSNFSLFTFFGIFISSSKSKKSIRDNRGILLSSFLMFTSNSFLFFEINRVISGNPSAILTFITYSTLFCAIHLLLHLIRKLYSEDENTNIKKVLFFGFLVGLIFSILAVFEISYLLRTLAFGIVIFIPIAELIYFLVKNRLHIFGNVFFYQFSLASVVYCFKILNIIFLEPNAYFDTVSKRDIIFTMLITVIIITIFTSYLFEKQQILNNRLASKTSILESTLIKVKNISETDQLTKLANRYKIDEYLNILKDRHTVLHEEFSLIMCDINDFKSINDTYGHNIGDEILKFTSSSLTKSLREKDIIGRWGGDEFIILLPETSNIHIPAIKSKIKQYFLQNSCSHLNQHITLSMGSATYNESSNIEDLIHNADIKMYNDKKSYKGS